MHLENRVVIVTGGGTGIGRATALQLALAGAKVLITGRRSTPLRETAEGHANIVDRIADVTDPGNAQSIVEHVVEQWGRLDVIVNNAARMVQQPLGEIEAEAIAGTFATNVLGPTMLVQAAMPWLEQTRGAIVNISSTYGHKPAPGIGLYAASKAAIEHLTRCWALELAPRGIRVNAVAPGPTETPALANFGLSPEAMEAIKRREIEMIPLGRRGLPDEVARWIVRLASPAEDWVTGQVISVDGGLNLV